MAEDDDYENVGIVTRFEGSTSFIWTPNDDDQTKELQYVDAKIDLEPGDWISFRNQNDVLYDIYKLESVLETNKRKDVRVPFTVTTHVTFPPTDQQEHYPHVVWSLDFGYISYFKTDKGFKCDPDSIYKVTVVRVPFDNETRVLPMLNPTMRTIWTMNKQMPQKVERDEYAEYEACLQGAPWKKEKHLSNLLIESDPVEPAPSPSLIEKPVRHIIGPHKPEDERIYSGHFLKATFLNLNEDKQKETPKPPKPALNPDLVPKISKSPQLVLKVPHVKDLDEMLLTMPSSATTLDQDSEKLIGIVVAAEKHYCVMWSRDHYVASSIKLELGAWYEFSQIESDGQYDGIKLEAYDVIEIEPPFVSFSNNVTVKCVCDLEEIDTVKQFDDRSGYYYPACNPHLGKIIIPKDHVTESRVAELKAGDKLNGCVIHHISPKDPALPWIFVSPGDSDEVIPSVKNDELLGQLFVKDKIIRELQERRTAGPPPSYQVHSDNGAFSNMLCIVVESRYNSDKKRHESLIATKVGTVVRFEKFKIGTWLFVDLSIRDEGGKKSLRTEDVRKPTQDPMHTRVVQIDGKEKVILQDYVKAQRLIYVHDVLGKIVDDRHLVKRDKTTPEVIEYLVEIGFMKDSHRTVVFEVLKYHGTKEERKGALIDPKESIYPGSIKFVAEKTMPVVQTPQFLESTPSTSNLTIGSKISALNLRNTIPASNIDESNSPPIDDDQQSTSSNESIPIPEEKQLVYRHFPSASGGAIGLDTPLDLSAIKLIAEPHLEDLGKYGEFESVVIQGTVESTVDDEKYEYVEPGQRVKCDKEQSLCVFRSKRFDHDDFALLYSKSFSLFVARRRFFENKELFDTHFEVGKWYEIRLLAATKSVKVGPLRIEAIAMEPCRSIDDFYPTVALNNFLRVKVQIKCVPGSFKWLPDHKYISAYSEIGDVLITKEFFNAYQLQNKVFYAWCSFFRQYEKNRLDHYWQIVNNTLVQLVDDDGDIKNMPRLFMEPLLNYDEHGSEDTMRSYYDNLDQIDEKYGCYGDNSSGENLDGAEETIEDRARFGEDNDCQDAPLSSTPLGFGHQDGFEVHSGDDVDHFEDAKQFVATDYNRFLNGNSALSSDYECDGYEPNEIFSVNEEDASDREDESKTTTRTVDMFNRAINPLSINGEPESTNDFSSNSVIELVKIEPAETGIYSSSEDNESYHGLPESSSKTLVKPELEGPKDLDVMSVISDKSQALYELDQLVLKEKRELNRNQPTKYNTNWEKKTLQELAEENQLLEGKLDHRGRIPSLTATRSESIDIMLQNTLRGINESKTMDINVENLESANVTELFDPIEKKRKEKLLKNQIKPTLITFSAPVLKVENIFDEDVLPAEIAPPLKPEPIQQETDADESLIIWDEDDGTSV